MTEARLDVVIGSQGAVSGGNAVARIVNEVKSNFLDLSAKVFVAQQALDRVWTLAKGGAEFEQTMGRLNRQMTQFDASGQLMIASLQRISVGQLSVGQSATLASRALAAGLNPEQIKLFTEAASTMGDVMGTDIPTAFNEIVTAAMTGRSAVLANIGVYVDLNEEMKKLAVETNRTTDQITKQERAMLTAKAISAQAGDALSKLTDGQVTDANRLAAVEARWADLWTTIGRGAKDAVLAVLDYNSKLQGLFRSLIPSEELSRKLVPDFMKPSKREDLSQNPAVWQSIMGRAIVQQTQGELVRQAERGPVQGPFPLARQFKVQELEGRRDRNLIDIDAQVDRTMAHLQAQRTVIDINRQRGITGALDATGQAIDLQLKEIETTRKAAQHKLTIEQDFHAKRINMEFENRRHDHGAGAPYGEGPRTHSHAPPIRGGQERGHQSRGRADGAGPGSAQGAKRTRAGRGAAGEL